MTTIHLGFLRAAALRPDTTAIEDPAEGSWTYGELADTVDHLAEAVRARVPAGRRVAVVTTKHARTVVRMLAALRAGRAYVPLDPSAPAERRRFVVEDAGCDLVLGDDPRDPSGAPVLTDLAPCTPAAATEPEPGLDDEAYVLYTSGSTGTPKGVVITHRNAAAFVDWAATAFPLTTDDHVAVHAPLHFDLPVYDVFVALAAGATLHLVGERTALFPQSLQRFLAERAITHLYAVPSALTALVQRSTLTQDGLPHLRRLLYAGEEFRSPVLRAFMEAVPGATVANLYGPIETNVVTSHTLTGPPADTDRIPIGRPATGVHVGLLDEDGRVHLEGETEGELVVGGDPVTPGYLHRPELTASTRLTAATPAGELDLYRTGDIARRDADGVLHLLGRRDGLVKTRGYRVELGEIEAVAGACASVAEVAVAALPDPDLTHRLHALVIPADGAGTAEDTERAVLLRCRDHLPGYMVPSSVLVVDDLPRTSTGKIARSELGELIGA